MILEWACVVRKQRVNEISQTFALVVIQPANCPGKLLSTAPAYMLGTRDERNGHLQVPEKIIHQQ